MPRGRRPARNSIVSSPGTRGEAEGAGVAPESEPDESMNSRVSWSVEGIDPSVRERAEAAARRAGMSLNDWLVHIIGQSTPSKFSRAPRSAARDAEPAEPRRRRHSPAAGFDHPPDRADLAAEAAQRCAAERRAPWRRAPRPAGAAPANGRRG